MVTIHAHVGKLVVHQVASEIAADVARLAERLKGPGAKSRAYQIVRSSLSIPSNIAEACGRGTIPEFRTFLMYARGSAQELRTQLEVVRRLDRGVESTVRALESRVVLVIKMIGRLYDNPPRSN
jgi:four helix bundle protein